MNAPNEMARLKQIMPLLKSCLLIDAGVANIRLRRVDQMGLEQESRLLPSNCDLHALFSESGGAAGWVDDETPVLITGKLAPMVRSALGRGYVFANSGALWLAAQNLIKQKLQARSLALVEVSASGYMLIGVDPEGALKDDLLLLNPRCGAGSGVNIDRVLQKLGITREGVDEVLAEYLGEAARDKRARILTRADRCGVFGASATVSDKNQGIPLAVALATTLKSEILKVMRKLPEGFEHVVLCGRFFRWQFVQDCATDVLREIGVKHWTLDTENTHMLDAVRQLVSEVGIESLSQPALDLIAPPQGKTYPAFAQLKEQYETDLRYKRVAADRLPETAALGEIPVHIGLDVGSTMAKVALSDDEGQLLFVEAYSNAGDTIATVKRIFSALSEQGLEGLHIRSIGITGSARYQVRDALSNIYPKLFSRLSVLVENYAHARGSIDQARAHVKALKDAGVEDVNEDFCILVDIGGEDTKISTIALAESELFNNAMNIKCSAGTGSLMDTLSALFGVPGAKDAGLAAMRAPKAFEINATCAVFLMENAQKLLADGVPREEIFASANWAIVENMARTLWSQVELPKRSIVLLHGQTMLSDPLPLAVTHRLQEYLGDDSFALVPPYPGHRATIGLIRTMLQTAPAGSDFMAFQDFLNAHFDKRIIQCKGAACSDPDAVCNRTSLKCKGADGKNVSFTLGGCSAINELFARARERKSGQGSGVAKETVRDAYKEIWDAIDAAHPKTDAPNRLVIPRSFVVSEWAYFLSEIFTHLGIEVHVDNVREEDLNRAQPFFDVDSCAPHMGAVGQFVRLAKAPHGVILAPQIDLLPTDGKGLGRTCTLNQGGMAVSRAVAQDEVPDANIVLFDLDLSELQADKIADQLYLRLGKVFEHYGLPDDLARLSQAVEHALDARKALRHRIAEMTAEMIEEAMEKDIPVALVVGREYLLTPGIYDSHVRRLLRDKSMLAIPSYVLDVALDETFSHIYWRNPQLITSILSAIVDKKLHQRIGQTRLAKCFEQLEARDELLPVVQVSTFCCGPDSVSLPLIAEMMKSRPFLLIQSDAIIKELAHLENRVNTYVRQLETGLHQKYHQEANEPFAVDTLKTLEQDRAIDRNKDVIYFPTLGDNRVLTSVLRGAGFTCIDNYEEGFNLEANIKAGRKSVGDSVCAPMAGVFSDLQRAEADFAARRAANDPLVAGKSRLLFFDNTGTGPCRQGQYLEVHKLTYWKDKNNRPQETDGCGSGMEGILRFLVARETEGYDFGLEEWTMLRMYQAAILQGVLHEVQFQAAKVCQSMEDFQTFQADFQQLKADVYQELENFAGPGLVGRTLSKLPGTAGAAAKYYAYQLDGSGLARYLKKFAQRWLPQTTANQTGERPIRIQVSGEVYMRVAQIEEIFRRLVALIGFGRFELTVAPVWGYADYLIEEAEGEAQASLDRLNLAMQRRGATPEQQAEAQTLATRIEKAQMLRSVLRDRIARPLYEAAGIPMPHPAKEAIEAAAKVLPTRKPIGELGPFVGEALIGLKEGCDLFINVAPTGCMVSTMGAVLGGHLQGANGDKNTGRVQSLFSASGELDDELLALALLKCTGPKRYFARA